MSTESSWLQWSDASWSAIADRGGELIALCERLLQTAMQTESVATFLQRQLPEIATALSAQWIGIVQRSDEWNLRDEFGRLPAEIPFYFAEEALDHDAGGLQAVNEPPGWKLLAVPLISERFTDETDDQKSLNNGSANNELFGTVVMMAGRNLSADSLPAAVSVARVLAFCLRIITQQTRQQQRIERLKATLQMTSAISGVRETSPLLEMIAQEATRLLNCDRASIFIWDKEHNEVVACPALGVPGGTLRIPDRTGIVGDVIHSGEPARVDSTLQDRRFDNSVDEKSGYVTHNLLCWPMHDANGELVGAFEVINKNPPEKNSNSKNANSKNTTGKNSYGQFTNDDEEILELLSSQATTAIQNTREREQLVRSQEQLTEQVTQGVQIIGKSPSIIGLRATVSRLANTDLPVFIFGPSGTGKEVVAQSLHYQGGRAKSPFVAVNCAAIAETLLESELFGHEKGAFTDAHESRPGKFELAEGGTLFLDEIGDMSLPGQAKLLRVLEQKVVTPVGGAQPIPINVRIIAATNANLVERVSDKTFREDLYYRLSVVTLHLPPLSERPEDILLLADHFLNNFCAQARRKSLHISSEARRRLQAHSWPGNIRELRNLMERVAFLTQGDKVQTDDLAFILRPDSNSTTDPSIDLGFSDATKQFQRDFIRQAIHRVRGNVSEAARFMGLHRSNLYRKMRQLGMNEADGFDE